MVSPLASAISAAMAQTRPVRGEAITYSATRDAVLIEIDITNAVRAATNWTADETSQGARVGEKSIDWLIESAELVDADGVEFEPERGDTITDSAGSVYRVMPFGTQSQLWQWHDRASQTTARVFTKERT